MPAVPPARPPGDTYRLCVLQVQYVALRNINLVVQKRPAILANEVKVGDWAPLAPGRPWSCGCAAAAERLWQRLWRASCMAVGFGESVFMAANNIKLSLSLCIWLYMLIHKA